MALRKVPGSRRATDMRMLCANDYRWVVLLWLVLALPGCSDNQAPLRPPQHWQDLEIALETRPVQVRTGMNEFLLIATTARGLPGSDMIVSLRMTAADVWHQTIQDGHSGVFRRAIRVGANQQSVQVQLIRGDEQTVLEFPLLRAD